MTNPTDVEVALLGLMISDPKAIEGAAALEASDLHLDSHRRMLAVIRVMHSKGEEVNLVTFVAELNRQNLTSAVGGVGYVAELTNDAHRGRDVGSYVRILKVAAARRNIVALCEVATARAESGDDPDDILHGLQGTAVEIISGNVQLRPAHISEFVVPTADAMKCQKEFTGEVLGIPTGIATLDAAMGGWREGELTYVGARPGSGKTSFMLQAMHSAATQGFPVGCISLEMRAQQLMRRLGTIQSGLPAYKFRDPRQMNASEWLHAKRSMYALGDLPVYVNDQSGLKPAAIASLARQMHAAGARVIFVDFVQIIHEDGRDRREAINRVSAALRDTCKALEIPFVVLSQLARRDADPNRRPTMQDLRESGNLEQDGHNVLLLFRPKGKNGEWTGEDEIIVEKHREGQTGPILVSYNGRSLTFCPRQH